MNWEPTNPPRDYRLRLYEAYSANFGEGKRFVPGVQFRQYEIAYRGLVPSSSTVAGDLGCGKGGDLLKWDEAGIDNLVKRSNLKYKTINYPLHPK